MPTMNRIETSHSHELSEAVELVVEIEKNAGAIEDVLLNWKGIQSLCNCGLDSSLTQHLFKYIAVGKTSPSAFLLEHWRR